MCNDCEAMAMAVAELANTAVYNVAAKVAKLAYQAGKVDMSEEEMVEHVEKVVVSALKEIGILK